MRFSKMQGVGNDFVVLNADTLPAGTDWAAQALRLCARHAGIGADGLLTVSRTAPRSPILGERMAPPGPNPWGAGQGQGGTSLPHLEGGVPEE